MPTRKLHQQPSKNGHVRFALEPGDEVSESDAASELMAIIFEADPAIDARTGRLIPGKRISRSPTSLFLIRSNSGGASRLGGIACAERDAEIVARYAAAGGYVVTKDV